MKTTMNLKNKAAQEEQLSKIQELLAKNPYSEAIQMKSTQVSHFFRDEAHNTVNRYQKPLGFYLLLLKMFAMPNTTVFDATCGTGSLELAACEVDAPNNLTFVAFERNKYQSKHAAIRWQKACTPPTSALDVSVDVAMESINKFDAILTEDTAAK